MRIPIERAMELIAQQRIAGGAGGATAPLMTGDAKPVVTVPLTNGFARTGYEQEEAQAEAVEAQARREQEGSRQEQLRALEELKRCSA